MLLADKQTDKQRASKRQKYNLLCRGNNKQI